MDMASGPRDGVLLIDADVLVRRGRGPKRGGSSGPFDARHSSSANQSAEVDEPRRRVIEEQTPACATDALLPKTGENEQKKRTLKS